MSYNGSGVFNINSTGQPVVAGTNITASVFNALTADLATGLSTAICKDGQTTVTANIPFNSYKITGIGAATARTDAASLANAQDGTGVFAAAGGTADAITASFSPAVTAVVDGMMLRVRAANANATTTPTFSPNGLTARTIVKQGGQALAAGDIRAANHDLLLVYRATGTVWELLNPTFPTTLALTGLLISGGTQETALTASDAFPFYDVSATANRYAALGDVFKAATTLTAESSLASGDEFLVVDVSEGAANKTTLATLAPAVLANVTGANMPAGTVAQIVSAVDGAVATGTTVLPLDDTIPQNTEGDEYMSLAITPKSASSTLIIQANLFLSHNNDRRVSMALFRDSGADALAAVTSSAQAAGDARQVTLIHRMASPGTGSTTFKLRAGGPSAGTTTFNGVGGARLFGGVASSSVVITEIM